MELKGGAHLAYCTNIHPGETWPETFASLRTNTLGVRDRVDRNRRFAIGLRLSDKASRELLRGEALGAFREWLAAENCYVFTINGFPYGQFHGGPVKEKVFTPDWITRERLLYTNRLFDILAALLPDGLEGSVSTLPGSFKEFICNEQQIDAIVENLWRCIDHISELSQRTGRVLHLGLEPEPFGLFENRTETIAFFTRMAQRRPNDSRLRLHLGLNYDACHFALQFEEAAENLNAFREHDIQLSKIHLSSALRFTPNASNLSKMNLFADDVYLHQVIARRNDGSLLRYSDLPVALAKNPPSVGSGVAGEPADEWRVHFHVPLYASPMSGLDTTVDHSLAVLDWLAAHSGACTHLEMETYTWAVLPPVLKSANVIDQLVREYEWILPQLAARDLL